MAWKRAPCSSHSLRSLGNTSRSAFKSSKVELTKTRNVRVAMGMVLLRKNDDSVFLSNKLQLRDVCRSQYGG
jgi:hypothetical protein